MDDRDSTEYHGTSSVSESGGTSSSPEGCSAQTGSSGTSVLTGAAEGHTYGSCNESHMSDISDLENKILSAVREAYRRGVQDGIANIVRAAHGSIPASDDDTQNETGIRSRAPSGSAPALVTRVLNEVGTLGATTTKIQESANTFFEKMVSLSAIRNELKMGEKINPPKYKQVGGVWYLNGKEPRFRAVIS